MRELLHRCAFEALSFRVQVPIGVCAGMGVLSFSVIEHREGLLCGCPTLPIVERFSWLMRCTRCRWSSPVARDALAGGESLVNADVAALPRVAGDPVPERRSPSPSRRTDSRMTSEPPALPSPSPSPAPRDGVDAPRAAFDAAIAAHRGELLLYMRKRLREHETADDLTQETLSRMMKYRDSPGIEDYRLMLFRIANNLILEYRRAAWRHHAADHVSLDEIEPLSSDAPSPERIVGARMMVDLLIKETLAGLPRRCRLAFTLSRFQGLTYPQVAERMGISVKVVEKHVSRALLACRDAVGDRDF